MTAIAWHDSTTRTRPARPAIREAIGRAARALIDRWTWRRTVARLARHDPRLLRDMGFEPEAIRAAAAGTWDEVGRPRLMDY